MNDFISVRWFSLVFARIIPTSSKVILVLLVLVLVLVLVVVLLLQLIIIIIMIIIIIVMMMIIIIIIIIIILIATIITIGIKQQFKFSIVICTISTAKKKKTFSIKDFFSKYDQIRRFLMNIPHPKEQKLPFKQMRTTTIFSFGYQSCVWPRSDPIFC